MYSTLAFIGLYIDVGDRALISIGHNMGTGSSREVETPRRLSLTNSPLTRKPRYDYTRPSNNQNGRPSMQRPIWTPNPSPPPRQPRYYLFNLAVLGLFQGHIWGVLYSNVWLISGGLILRLVIGTNNKEAMAKEVLQ